MNIDHSVMVIDMLIITVVGWSLFVLITCLYFVGNKINVREEQALALYSLAVLFSDEFRTANRTGFEMVVEEAHSKNVSTDRIVYGLMTAVEQNAKRYHNPAPGELSTLALVFEKVGKS
jgi:hypothetical protein